MSEKILGFWSGHDCSFCVLEDGVPILHTEYERHLRVKEPPGDSIGLFYEHDGNTENVIGLATCHRDVGIKEHVKSWERIAPVAPLHVCGHHQAHAANAFYSSDFEEAMVITVDGGGIENAEGFTVGASVWYGRGTQLELRSYFPLEQVNIGGVWSRTTRHIFRFENGHPFGNQAGSTMALAAMAKDPRRFEDDFKRMFTTALAQATSRAPGDIRGTSAKDPNLPVHPFLQSYVDLAARDEQAKYDMAGALQHVTEMCLYALLNAAEELCPGVKNVCFVGGVALNSCAMGEMAMARPDLKFFVPPVPYDAGLTIGAAQHAWHHVLGRPRVKWGTAGATPYLGKLYSQEEIDLAITEKLDQLDVGTCDDSYVVDLLADGKIVAVFNGRAESGRRALGNRSILADPRRADMKDIVNLKVKHRQVWRPYAPSIIRESVKEWFERDVDSPYMSFVLKFKPEKAKLVPAVVHFDGSARLQTVTRESNRWYYEFLEAWEAKSGVPMLLNSSYNDREPIVERPEHAIDCFLRTEIDHVYFPEHNILLTKK